MRQAIKTCFGERFYSTVHLQAEFFDENSKHFHEEKELSTKGILLTIREKIIEYESLSNFGIYGGGNKISSFLILVHLFKI